MWKISKIGHANGVLFSISGRIEAGELLELQKAILLEEGPHQKVDLDLENLRLVDQQVVTYLAACELAGARLRNCPSYIRQWIDLEKTSRNHDGQG